jgi:endoglucanase
MRFHASWLGWILCFWMTGAHALGSAPEHWAQWDIFVARFIQADGRVIDLTFDRKSTSEGQAYALFLALVNNQRNEFDTILKWTSNNLAAGQLGAQLPAWLWGLRDDGSWGVKDRSSASDADLWLAYSLLEAGRLWGVASYRDTGRQLLALIAHREVVSLGTMGPVLLPGPNGFTLEGGRLRLDPSYLPGFMFRYLAVADPSGPWQSVWESYLRMAPEAFRSGVAPDLFVVDASGRVMPDTQADPIGSYDAIRVYLWAGMSGDNSHGLLKLLTRYDTLLRVTGVPPEKVNAVTGDALVSNYSPLGFSGAVLPFLSALGDQGEADKQLARLGAASQRAPRGESTNYYDQVLALLGQGWYEGYYRFDADGRVQPRWTRT